MANEAGIKLEVLNPLESLIKEQMNNGEDYVSVMEDNLKALEKTTMVAEVFDYKAKLNKDMTAAEYKDYYTTGYEIVFL